MNLLADGSRDADAIGRRERFEPRGDVDAIPGNVVAVHDDVADVDADPQANALIGAALGFARDEIALDVERALQRGSCARELGEESVARRLHETAAVRVDLRLRNGVAQMLKPRKGRRLVALHQTTEAGDVGHHDRRELARGCTAHELRLAAAIYFPGPSTTEPETKTVTAFLPPSTGTGPGAAAFRHRRHAVGDRRRMHATFVAHGDLPEL